MATPFIFKNIRLFVGPLDLTGASNKVEFAAEVEEKDATTFGSYDPDTNTVWKEVIGGLGSGKISAEGLWQAGDATMPDDGLWAQLGTVDVWTVLPHTATVGSVAWLTKGMDSKYMLGGTVGDIAPWQAEAPSSWPISRGAVLHNPGTAVTATSGTDTSVTIPAVATSQGLYASLHVLSVSGTSPSLTVTVQTDATSGFGSPSTAVTFTAATSAGAQIARVAGPITDTNIRVSYTTSGTSQSILFMAAFGVGH